MNAKPTAETVSREFRRILQVLLTAEDLNKIDSLNGLENDPNICHSHDFVDANVYMLEAFSNVGFGDEETVCNELTNGDDELNRIWNHAWSIAKFVGFSMPVS